MVIGDHFGGGDHFDGGDHFGGGTGLWTVYNGCCASYDDLLRRAKMTTLYNRRLQDIAMFMFKMKHGMLSSSVTELFNTSHTNYNLRNADFRQECFNTTKYGKHSLKNFSATSLVQN